MIATELRNEIAYKQGLLDARKHAFNKHYSNDPNVFQMYELGYRIADVPSVPKCELTTENDNG